MMQRIADKKQFNIKLDVHTITHYYWHGYVICCGLYFYVISSRMNYSKNGVNQIRKF